LKWMGGIVDRLALALHRGLGGGSGGASFSLLRLNGVFDTARHESPPDANNRLLNGNRQPQGEVAGNPGWPRYGAIRDPARRLFLRRPLADFLVVLDRARMERDDVLFAHAIGIEGGERGRPLRHIGLGPADRLDKVV